MSETNDKVKRRRFTAPELNLISALTNSPEYQSGAAIPYASLPTEHKATVMADQNKLVRFGLISRNKDPETFQVVSVTVNANKVAEFDAYLKPEMTLETVTKVATGDSPGKKSVVDDPKYVIRIESAANPYTADVVAYKNWEFYQDGMTVPDYLNAEQTQDSRWWKSNRGKWYDGPTAQQLYIDMAKGYITVWDMSYADNPQQMTKEKLDALRKNGEPETMQEAA